MTSRTTRGLAALTLVLSSLSLGCAGSKEATSAGSTSSMGASALAAASGAAGLYKSLGGSAGVTALSSAFGANLAKNATVTKFLSAADLVTAQDGLTNSIAKLAGAPTVGSGADLLSALSGKGLDAAAISGVGQALNDAAATQGLKPEQQAALTTLWEPVGKSLMAGN